MLRRPSPDARASLIQSWVRLLASLRASRLSRTASYARGQRPTLGFASLRASLAAALLLLTACGAGTRERAFFEQNFPALGSERARFLSQTTPYVFPSKGSLVLFLCRWDTRAPIPYALGADATSEERSLTALVLRAWERAGLGVHFLEVPSGVNAPFEIVFRPQVQTDTGEGAGRTVADCQLSQAGDTSSAGAPLAAELVFASIWISRRTPPDWRGHTRVMVPEEIVGTLAHEVAHALGFQGHIRGQGSVLERSHEEIVAKGRRLLAGEALRDSALWALFKKQPPEIERAQEHLERAITLNPENALAHQHLGLVLRSTGDTERAEKMLARAKKLDPKLT